MEKRKWGARAIVTDIYLESDPVGVTVTTVNMLLAEAREAGFDTSDVQFSCDRMYDGSFSYAMAFTAEGTSL